MRHQPNCPALVRVGERVHKEWQCDQIKRERKQKWGHIQREMARERKRDSSLIKKEKERRSDKLVEKAIRLIEKERIQRVKYRERYPEVT